MASILDRYGIKEVADVTFYKISDGSNGIAAGEPAEPVLYLDTLKVSTTEQTAENTSARGGKGNPELIIWDYGKEITVTLEDALFSAKSMAVMFGDGERNLIEGSASETIKKTWRISESEAQATSAPTQLLHGGKTINLPSDQSGVSYYDAKGAKLDSWGASVAFLTFDIPVEDKITIDISAETFPGTYYVTGDTYARSETTGEDEFFQFIIPKAKVMSEVTLTMEAEGDPSTFSMNLRVLRPSDGKMMKLVKYNIADADTLSVG